MLLSIGPTFIWTIVNLIVLYLFLRWLLFKPVTSFIENRTNSIKDSIDNAERLKTEAFEIKKKYENQINTAKDEADKIISEAKAKANKQYEEILNTARKDSQIEIQRAKEEIEREKVQMIKEVKNHVASLAIAAASKIIEANMDNESNRKLVDKFIERNGAA